MKNAMSWTSGYALYCMKLNCVVCTISDNADLLLMELPRFSLAIVRIKKVVSMVVGNADVQFNLILVACSMH